MARMRGVSPGKYHKAMITMELEYFWQQLVISSMPIFWHIGHKMQLICNIVDRVSLIRDGEYNFNVIKEIACTESFLTLNKRIRRCQEEPFNICINRKYNNVLVNKCQCVPFKTRLTQQVD